MQTSPSPDPATQNDRHFIRWVKNFLKRDIEPTLRETIGEYINEPEAHKEDPVSQQERLLLANILKLRHMSVVNVMIPRADIVAIEAGTTQEELLALLAEKQYSRIPVYRGTLDDVLGTIHIKDVLASLAKGEKLDIRALIKEIPIVSPAMTLLNLMLTMRESKRHMALVVDEYGGIDGLVTVNDVIESIVGEIEDEHHSGRPEIESEPDGSYLADARLGIDEFEKQFGSILTAAERESADTLAGLLFMMAGRIPARGEILTHSNGMVFEVVDADLRHVNLLKIRNIPQKQK
ncbi:MAG: HlyC/CorC family transporter [Alphaproteobacteria bacterium]|nr:HlyC/CorC family transporter [Alphaproteobacteria bacterium]